jgi:N-acetylglutamate synthase-like GNAT family acetyltransferase
MAVKTFMAMIDRNARSESGVRIRLATQRDVDKILFMINAEASVSGAVDRVTEDMLKGWVALGNSYVAEGQGGTIVGHRAVLLINNGWAELRSAVVDNAYRGNGVGYKLAEALLDGFIRNNPEIKYIVSVKNEASNGRGILLAIGFEKIPRNNALDSMLSIPNEERWELYVLDAERYRLKESVRS